MKRLYKEIEVSSSIEKVWDFFSDPRNLNDITPPDLNFEILTNPLPRMYQGQIIEYKVEFIRGIKSKWVTEIRHVREGEYFVDEQRLGPYKFWYHEHIFIPTKRGVKIIDKVHYEVGYSILGEVLNLLWISKKLAHIFDFREKTIAKIFGRVD